MVKELKIELDEMKSTIKLLVEEMDILKTK